MLACFVSSPWHGLIIIVLYAVLLLCTCIHWHCFIYCMLVLLLYVCWYCHMHGTAITLYIVCCVLYRYCQMSAYCNHYILYVLCEQGHQNKCESGEAQRMDIELHWQLPKLNLGGLGACPPGKFYIYML